MITAVYLDDDRLDSSKIFLQAVRNMTFPSIGSSSLGRGSFHGVKVIPSRFQSFKFATEWFIVGDDPEDLATQRETLVGLVGQIIKLGSRTFKINKNNDVDVQIVVKNASVAGDLKSENYHTCTMLISLEAEYPLFQSQELQSEDILIFTGGGMEIPMGIPMDMSGGATNEATLENNGNYDAFPVFTFYGPLENPSLSNLTTGETLNLNLTLLTSNDYVVVDTYSRTVMLYPSGNNARQYATGDFFTLQPGENVIHLSNSSYNGTAFCRVEFRDHYLGI